MITLSIKGQSRKNKGGTSGVYLSKPVVRAWEQVHSRKLTSQDVELMFDQGKHIPLKAVRHVYRNDKRNPKWSEIHSRVRIEMPEDWVRNAKKTISKYSDLSRRLEDIIAESLIADVPLRLVGNKQLRVVDNYQSRFNYIIECASYDKRTYLLEEDKCFRVHYKSSYQRPSKSKRKVGRTDSKNLSAEKQQTTSSTENVRSERYQRAMAKLEAIISAMESKSSTSFDRGFGE